jgi:hypothetical protein
MKMLMRDAILMGPPTQVQGWATSVAAAFEQATGRNVDVWTHVAGGINGHFTWSLAVEGAADLLEVTGRAMADEAYLAAVEEGREFMAAPMHDTLYEPFGAAELDEDAGAPGNVSVVTTATARAGSLGDAIGWGLEAAAYISELTGTHTTLLGNVAGSFSRLTWIGVGDDAAQADAAQAAMRSDEGYLKLIARGGQHFVDGSARTQLFARLA